jgi:hypothetical protein
MISPCCVASPGRASWSFQRQLVRPIDQAIADRIGTLGFPIAACHAVGGSWLAMSVERRFASISK